MPEDEVNGKLNLLKMITLLCVLRAVLGNINEHGLLMKIPFSSIELKEVEIMVALLLGTAVTFRLLFLLTDHKRLFALIGVAHFLTITCVTCKTINNPKAAATIYTLTIWYGLKLVSIFMNRNRISNSKFIRFMFHPTLVYKNRFRLKKRVNFTAIACKTVQGVLSLLVLLIFIDQYGMPTLYKLVEARRPLEFAVCYSDLVFSTITLFYLYFQALFVCFLQVCGECSRFDEKIYFEWWNSTSSREFWSKWNMPVHIFIKEQIYKPLLNRNHSKATIFCLCFLISGIMHEYVLSMTMRRPCGLFFAVMILQLPFLIVSDFVQKYSRNLGNYFFWVNFSIIGQPVVLILIFRSVYNQ
ncbi:DGAT1 [Enterospora canceri]|uniref:DGAT1 n=1 Tax=Enterospora canceri TaxID=1081671 RepID=A0A1Y1S8L2_9MICR|nr:DGAT1 [Enterospora canceri]